jgi:two-component system, NarL family, sensor kinase
MQSPAAAIDEPANPLASTSMTHARRTRYRILAWSLCAVSFALLIGAFVLAALAIVAHAAGGPLVPAYRYITNSTGLLPADIVAYALSLAALVAFALIGALIVTRYPTHPIGWIMSMMSLFGIGEEFASYYAIYSLLIRPGALPYGLIAAWITEWTWTVFAGLLNVFLPLLFPTGRSLSPRWRWASWFAGIVCTLLTFGFMIKPGRLGNRTRLAEIESPFHLVTAGQVEPVVLLGFLGLLLSMLMAAVSLIVRLRRARGVERQQIKWFGYPAALLALLFIFQGVMQHLLGLWPPTLNVAYRLTWATVFTAFPIAIGIAILKYRLYDIDLIINRTLVYGALSASVAGIYVLVVGALGTLFQARGDLVISLIGTVLVALLFQPLRQRLQRGVNRLMYGERDDPYAVLSRLGQQLEATLAPNAVLPTIVETVAQALKLPYVGIALKQEDELVIAAEAGDGRWEMGDRAAHPQPPTPNSQLPLIYQGETVGQLILAPRVGDATFSAADRRLLDDIAHQAGVAVHALRLTADLQRSRERLVAAREEERRRLRRDLHDGLGPQLATQTLKLEAARDLVMSDPNRAADLLSGLITDSQNAIADIRRLVYALRPPALDDLGLISAVREQAAHYRTDQLAIVVDAPDRLPPLPAAVEVAAYRIVQEALTNVVKHARAQTCAVQIQLLGEGIHRTLSLEVRDDGVGLPAQMRSGIGHNSMRERAEELGGVFVMVSGRGTRVSAYLPAPQLEE